MENVLFKKILMIMVTAAAALTVIFCILLVLRKTEGTQADTEKQTTTQISVAQGKAGEDSFTEEPVGDSGDDVTAGYSREGSITPYGEKGSRETLIALAVEKDRCIPYCSDGIDESLEQGYVNAGGVDNYSAAYAHGMTSASYVVWLYRNTFGNCGPEFNNLPDLYKRSEKISSGELLPGDIGMYYCDTGEGNHYGVCIGFYDGIPLFTHCSSLGTSDFPAGCNRISLLKSASDRYFSGSEPADFRYFFRPDVAWTDTEGE